jgi:tRNA (guanine37-N1)-methyltransferase
VRIEVVTLFPQMIRQAVEFGIVGRALERQLLEIGIEDPRAHTANAHRTVDDRPYGGGPGMVLKPEPMLAAIRAAHTRLPAGCPRICLSAQGELFGAAQARELAALPGFLLIAGRYEGIDERVMTLGVDRELSIGDYVLSGGELGAAVIIEAVMRLLPGAVGNEASTRQESFTAHERTEPGAADSTCGSGGLLDYPHYTRPADFRGMPVPEVLLNGDHQEIRRWRRQRALEKTLRNRPDLLDGAQLSDEDAKILARIKRDNG